MTCFCSGFPLSTWISVPILRFSIEHRPFTVICTPPGGSFVMPWLYIQKQIDSEFLLKSVTIVWWPHDGILSKCLRRQWFFIDAPINKNDVEIPVSISNTPPPNLLLNWDGIAWWPYCVFCLFVCVMVSIWKPSHPSQHDALTNIPMLVKSWDIVYDAGPTLNQHWDIGEGSW